MSDEQFDKGLAMREQVMGEDFVERAYAGVTSYAATVFPEWLRNEITEGRERFIAAFRIGCRSRGPEFLRPDAVAQGNADAQAEQAGQRYGQNGLPG